MLTSTQICEILADIEYKPGWLLNVFVSDSYLRSRPAPYLQWIFEAPDLDTGIMEEQRARKWQLSSYMTPSELVRTAYKAALAAEEHEASEAFKFRGQMVYDPHMDLQALAEAVSGSTVGQDYRDE